MCAPDIAEMGALGGALAQSSSSSSSGPLALASVKSEYGHTEGAAGLTGVLAAAAAVTCCCG